MMRVVSAALLGALFAAGLVVSGMVVPDNVTAFLDVTGDWNPALAVVMVGAIGTYLPGYLWIRGRRAPVQTEHFHWPTPRGIDARLLCGSALFGVGWGLSGLCPGPAIVAAGGAAAGSGWFGLGLLMGMATFEAWARVPRAHVELPQPSLADG